MYFSLQVPKASCIAYDSTWIEYIGSQYMTMHRQKFFLNHCILLKPTGHHSSALIRWEGARMWERSTRRWDVCVSKVEYLKSWAHTLGKENLANFLLTYTQLLMSFLHNSPIYIILYTLELFHFFIMKKYPQEALRSLGTVKILSNTQVLH